MLLSLRSSDRVFLQVERICSHHQKPLALSQGDWISYGRSVGNTNVRASRHNALITLFTQWGKSPPQPDFIGAASGSACTGAWLTGSVGRGAQGQ